MGCLKELVGNWGKIKGGHGRARENQVKDFLGLIVLAGLVHTVVEGELHLGAHWHVPDCDFCSASRRAVVESA